MKRSSTRASSAPAAVVTSWTVTVVRLQREPLSTEAVTIAAIAPPASAATRAMMPTAGVSRRERGGSGAGADSCVIDRRVHAPCVVHQGAQSLGLG